MKHLLVLLCCCIAIPVAQIQVQALPPVVIVGKKTIPEGYYAGVTNEGYGVGIHVAGEAQNEFKIRFRKYNSSNVYQGTYDMYSNRDGIITSYTFDNRLFADTSAGGGGTLGDDWNAQGTFNFTNSTYPAFINATGNFNWNNNLMSGTSGYQKSAATVTWTVYAIGATIPGSAPSGLVTATGSVSSVRMTWNALSGALSYDVYYAVSPYSSWVKAGSSLVGADTINGLTAGTVYGVKVSAVNIWGTTTYSPVTYGYTATLPPSGISASAVSQSKIQIGWSSAAGAVSYKIYRCNTSAGSFIPLNTTPSLSYVDSTLSTGATWYYKVSSINTTGVESPLSTYAGATTALATPVNITASTLSSSALRITWNTVAGASTYRVYQAPSPGTAFNYLATSTSTTYDDISLSPNATWYYAVVSFNGAESPMSTSAFATTAPAMPVNLAAVPVSSLGISLSWLASPGATVYRIYRSVSSIAGLAEIATAATTAYADSALTPLSTWYYAIRAEGTGGVSATSPRVSATTLAQPVLAVNKTAFSATCQTGTAASSQRLLVSNSGSGTLAYSCAKQGSWLVLGTQSGSATSETDTVSISFLSASLSAGTYVDTVTVSATGALNAPLRVAVTLSVTATPVPSIGLSSGIINRTAQKGSTPFSDTFFIFNSGAGTLEYTVSSPARWISLSRGTGSVSSTTDTVIVAYVITGLDTGLSSGVISVSCVSAPNSPQTITVNLSVKGAPLPEIQPVPTAFSVSVAAGAAPSDDTLFIYNAGNAPLPWTLSTDGSWITLSRYSGSVTTGCDTVIVGYRSSRLEVGTHTAIITISEQQNRIAPKTVAVSATVLEGPRPIPVISPVNLSFAGRAGDRVAAQQGIIRNIGTAPYTYTITTSAGWLDVLPRSGSSTNDTDTVMVSVVSNSTDTGLLSGYVIVSGTASAPESILVSFALTARARIIVNAPVPQDSISADSACTISWGSVGPVGGVGIEYSSYVNNPWTVIADSLPAQGEYAWNPGPDTTSFMRLRFVSHSMEEPCTTISSFFRVVPHSNRAPLIIIADTIGALYPYTIRVPYTVTDPDGDSVVTEFVNLPSWISALPGSRLSIAAPQTLQSMYSFSIRSTDSKGSTYKKSVYVKSGAVGVIRPYAKALPAATRLNGVSVVKNGLLFSYAVAQGDVPAIRVFTCRGILVARVETARDPGWHTLAWHGNTGRGMASGSYVVEFASRQSVVRRVVSAVW